VVHPVEPLPVQRELGSDTLQEVVVTHLGLGAETLS
jgi:hypothetical protein